MFSVNSHLTVKIYIPIIFACPFNIHDNKIIKINFRLCYWTPQPQEEYLKEKLPYTLVFLVNTVDFEGNYGLQYSCYYISQVADCIMY